MAVAEKGREYVPCPRTEELRLSTEFTRIRNEVWQAVHHQGPGSTAMIRWTRPDRAAITTTRRAR